MHVQTRLFYFTRVRCHGYQLFSLYRVRIEMAAWRCYIVSGRWSPIRIEALIGVIFGQMGGVFTVQVIIAAFFLSVTVQLLLPSDIRKYGQIVRFILVLLPFEESFVAIPRIFCSGFVGVTFIEPHFPHSSMLVVVFDRTSDDVFSLSVKIFIPVLVYFAVFRVFCCISCIFAVFRVFCCILRYYIYK